NDVEQQPDFQVAEDEAAPGKDDPEANEVAGDVPDREDDTGIAPGNKQIHLLPEEVHTSRPIHPAAKGGPQSAVVIDPAARGGPGQSLARSTLLPEEAAEKQAEPQEAVREAPKDAGEDEETVVTVRGWDSGTLDPATKNARLWNLITHNRGSKYLNLRMISKECAPLAGLGAKEVAALLVAQQRKASRNATDSDAPLSLAQLTMEQTPLSKCKLHERAGRDQIYLPTIPLDVNMQHVDRVSRMELETHLLPWLPKLDPMLHYNTCAIVANGGVMLAAKDGPEIDKHDAVFRINYAPVSGPASTGHDLSTHVGRRTTFDFVNRPNANMLLTGGHRWRAFPGDAKPGKAGKTAKPPIVVLCETIDRDARREQFLPLMQRNPGKDIYMINPQLIYTFRFVWHELRKVVERRHKNANYNDKPMTGWTTVMMALQMCSQVDLYGFQPYRGSAKELYHYFDSQAASLKVHSFDLAYEMLQLLGERLPVRLMAPPQSR
ncbi:hypothetical protein CYMTET_14553, partial [Cymbomonas tetramitiformis]